jgi:ubiquinone/menaquinone biosynthesis C-methylase UbiE
MLQSDSLERTSSIVSRLRALLRALRREGPASKRAQVPNKKKAATAFIPGQATAACGLCGGETQFTFTKKIMDRYDVAYFRCESCNSLQTEPPYWLEEAYSIPGVHVDVGIASRTVKNWFALTTFLDYISFPRAGLAIDFGGATGLLARLMRDVGYNFTAYDAYSDPFFVNYFVPKDMASLAPELVTAFEVFEHFPDPSGSLDEILRPQPRMVIFSTWFCDGQPDDWIYYSPECGQHVFFYTQEGMRRFAAERGYELQMSAFFYLLVRRETFDTAALRAIDSFIANAEPLVRSRVASVFESVKFGNDYIFQDYLKADRIFREVLASRMGEAATASTASAGAALAVALDPGELEKGLPGLTKTASPEADAQTSPTEITMTSLDTNPQWNFSNDQAKLLALGVHNQDTSDFDAIVASRHARKPEIMARLNLQPDDIVMDLGSGMGFIAEVIAPEVQKVHCCDISANFLEDCKTRTKHLDNIEFHQIAYADLSAARGKRINKAYSTLLFIHFNFYDIVYYLQELNRVLEKGGLFYFDFNDGERFRMDAKDDTFHEHLLIYRHARESWVFGCMHMTSAGILNNVAPQLGFRVAEHWKTHSSFSMMLLQKEADL